MPPFSQRTETDIIESNGLPFIKSDPSTMKKPMSDPTSDPSVIAQFWDSLPEPLKAAVMNVALSTVMAFRNKERTFWTAFLEVTGGGLITFMAGSAVEAFGLSNGWCFAIGGAVAVFGIDQVKAFAARFAEKKASE